MGLGDLANLKSPDQITRCSKNEFIRRDDRLELPVTLSRMLTERDQSMRHLLTGVAVVAALAFSAPLGAQQNPSGGNALGLPGPNPGGPGLTPYSTGPARSAAAPAPMATAPAAATPPPSSMSDTSSAMPPKHHHARHATSHGKMAGHHPSRFPNLQGNSVANQLNQAELARVQAGDFSNPPAPPSPDMGSAAPSSPRGANRMSTGGRATSSRYGN
jgi:hypothetical protein